MRLRRLVVRGFRNLDDLECEPPRDGVALLGANAQGKTNLLEAAYYPLLFRSLRGTLDHDVARFGGSGFHVEVHIEGGAARTVAATYHAAGRQRNAALRQGKTDVARAFDAPLAQAGAEVVRVRERWTRNAAETFAAELDCIGERAAATLRYRGNAGLADAAGWPRALDAALVQDRARGMTTIGPHRDDLVIEIGGRQLRGVGSTGQQRSAAVALKLVELVSLRVARDTEPALILDDVFAETDMPVWNLESGRVSR